MSANKDHFHDLECPLKEFVIIQSRDERFRPFGFRNCFILSSRDDRSELMRVLDGFANGAFGDSGLAAVFNMYGGCFSVEYFALCTPSHIAGLRGLIEKRGKYDE